MEQKEIILCAAIMFRDTMICGHRHGDCYVILKNLLSKYISIDNLPDREEQGFLTSFGRYVDRKEAWKIAKANNQIQFGGGASNDNEDTILISENLY